LHVRSIWDTPVEEPGLIHVVDSFGGVVLELLSNLGIADPRILSWGTETDTDWE